MGKGVSKESQNWLLSNVDVVPRHWRNKHKGVKVTFLFWCQREAVGNMDAPCTQLTLRSPNLLLLLDFHVCVRQCTQSSGWATQCEGSGGSLAGVCSSKVS